MDYVAPRELLADALELAKKKAGLRVSDMLLRGALAGVFLGYATSLALVVLSQGLPAILGAALFPVGFVILVLLGLELATGNFALLPPAVLSGDVRIGGLVRNWFWVYVGNLLGSLLYAVLFYLAITNFGKSDGGTLAELVRHAAEKKVVPYMATGTTGWFTALVKGMLCNWMVTIGTVLALASRSTVGKVVAMWLPVMTFFAHGYEHSVVNLYVIPAGMLFGAPISPTNWWIWNQVPVTLGNIISGALFTGMALYATYRTKPARAVLPAVMQDEDIQELSNAPQHCAE
ncbi:MAG: formate/nitrite transporter family protein [Terriglobales bacterium]